MNARLSISRYHQASERLHCCLAYVTTLPAVAAKRLQMQASLSVSGELVVGCVLTYESDDEEPSAVGCNSSSDSPTNARRIARTNSIGFASLRSTVFPQSLACAYGSTPARLLEQL
jgi:hypothetical protein